MKSWQPIVCALWLGSIAWPALAQQRHHSTAGRAHPPAEAAKENKPVQTEITQAERDKQARLQFEEGRKAFDEGNYRAAWGYFHEAYRLSGRAQLLFNIGQTADRLGHDADALTAFKMYLERLPKADNRRDVENRIRALEERSREAGRVPGPPPSPAPASEVSAPPPTAAAAAADTPAAAESDVAPPAPPPAAAAGPRPTRKGLYMRIGLGAGLRRDGVSGSVDAVVSGVGFAGELAIGGTLWPGFVLGGALFSDLAGSPSFESKGGYKADLNSAHLSMFGPMADWYIDPEANGFHVQAALTFAVVAVDYDNAGVSIGRDASGIGAMIGAGYEWPVAEEWAVGALGRIGLASLSDKELSHGMFTPSLVATVTWY